MEPSSNPIDLTAGDEVEVRQRFTADWARGFHVDGVDRTGGRPEVWLRRTSDGVRLPAGFAIDDVRAYPGGRADRSPSG